METQSYYRLLGANDNICRMDTPLCVNCAGVCVMRQPFASHALLGREDFYLQYMASGEMDMELGGVQAVLRPGEAVLHFPHTAYRYAMRGESTVVYYWVHFTGFCAESIARQCGFANQEPVHAGAHGSITVRFESLFRDFVERDACFELSACAGVLALLAEIARRARMDGGAGAADERVSRSIAYMHRAYGQPLSVAEMAAHVHLSESRFRHLFHQRTWLAPMEYLIQLRLSHARRLMAETALSIAEIARAVGYEDPFYFSRLFRQKMGAPPTEFRRSGA